MKSYFKLFVAVFFILAAVRTIKADYTVSGTVRYSDNNEIVTSGTVKLYDHQTLELVAQGQIEPTGDYLLGVVRTIGKGDIIGFPNVEPEADFVPTGYLDAIDPEQIVNVTINHNLTGIDVHVQRIVPPGNSAFLTNISGLVLDMNKKPVANAIVYASLGESYYGYGITNAKGQYIVTGIPMGNVNIAVHKIGSQSAYGNFYVTENGLSGVNFTMDKKNNNTIAPVQYNLSQNYPNPFNPVTNINYVIPVNGLVSIKVYNSLGQLTATLVNEIKEAGSYDVSFDASQLSSGVYFYRLEAGNYTSTKKMTLIK